MGGCCRASKGTPPPPSYDSPFCTKCGFNMLELFKVSAMQQTRGQTGEVSVVVRLNCPSCNVLNHYRVKLERRVTR